MNAVKAHIKLARNEVEITNRWGMVDKSFNIMTVEQDVPKTLINKQPLIANGTFRLPSFSKLISLADVKYTILSREENVGIMLARFWGIILTVGVLFRLVAQGYSRLHL